jgi:hypothetical protein
MQIQQMTAIVDDGNGHCPVIFQGFGLSGCGNGFHVGGFEEVFGFHEKQI